jgi:hypothetical protein
LLLGGLLAVCTVWQLFEHQLPYSAHS